MKDKVSRETDSPGLRLLKKGRRGLWRAVFSRAGMITLFLLLQLGLLLALFRFLKDFIPHYYSFSLLFTGVMGLYLINSRRESNAKLTWMLVILLLPVFGGLLYLYTQSELGHRILRDRYAAITRRTRDSLPQSLDTLVRLSEQAPEMEGLARYVNRSGCFPVYDETAVRYFPLGDDLFPALLEELEKAEKFIYLEFFIIEEGEMWGRVLEILARKAAAGLDVRLLYDGTNEFFTLPRDYARRLEKLGIRAKSFAPVMPFVSTHYNYRDHRKILVIDGKTAFTGGVNLADEYINRKNRFGVWKDSAVMVKGKAVNSFTLMFLQMWNMKSTDPEYYNRYMFKGMEHDENASYGGYVVPYGDNPLDDEEVGKKVYLDILNRANKYVHIMTPYLILDEEMTNSLVFAAQRGIDVKIIMPHIPDKKYAYALARTHYAELIRGGVKIYEYLPGFVHAKNFVSDDEKAVVGTINLDFRSFFLHFECAAYIWGNPIVDDVEADFAETLKDCQRMTLKHCKELPLYMKVYGRALRLIAPLM